MERTSVSGPVSVVRRAREHPGAGFLAIALAGGLWAAAAVVASDLFDRGVAPLELVLARTTVAAVGLAFFRRRFRKGSISLPHLVAFGLSIALVTATYYLAIERLAVAVAIVLQYTAPALVVTWIAIRARRFPRREILIALGAAVLGIVLVSELPGGELGDLDALGIVFGLSSAVLFATYTIVSARAGEAFGPFGAMFRAFAIAAGFWFVLQIPQGVPAPLFEPENTPWILFVGVMGTLAPFLLYVWGVARVAPERAAIGATVEPVLAGVFAWAWLGQNLSAMQVAGGALVVGAVVLLQVSRRSPRAPEP